MIGERQDLFYGTEEDYILTEFENENGASADMDVEDENGTPSDMGEEIYESDPYCTDAEASDQLEGEDDRSADGKNGAVYTREDYEASASVQ